MLDTPTASGTTLTTVPLPEAAFLFADIAGFTAFTELHGDARAAQLAWRLRLGVERQLGHDAHVVKTLGDAVMVRIADPDEAAAAGLRIVASALAPADPPVRVGVHWGPAVECDGDFFGAAVNVAARVVSVAGAGEVLVTEELARAARGRELALKQLGEHSLRGVARPVVLNAVRPAGTCEAPPDAPAERAGGRRAARRRRPRAPFVLQPNPAAAYVQL
jgi:adenylate cyclase